MTELGELDRASSNYLATCTKILELSQKAYTLYVSQERAQQRRLLNTLLSNCTFVRGTLTPTYNKPFDLLAEGHRTADWLGGRDSNPDYTVQSRGVLPLNDLPTREPQRQSDLIIGDGHACRGGSSVHPEFLTLGDLFQCLTGLPSHVWVRIVVKHLHKMLIRGGRLPERTELYQTRSQVSLGGQWAPRVVP